MIRKTRNQEISSLINSLVVGTKMQTQASAKGDDAGERLWFDHQAAVTVELADRFGIELPALDICRDHLRRVKARQLRAA